jgi:FG-GAP-like repeat
MVLLGACILIPRMMRGWRNSGLWIPAVLVCLLGLEAGAGLRILRDDAGPSRAGAGLSRILGNPFAVADFDGDWKPDLAVVETASGHRPEANYAIRLRFSASGELSFLVSAPNGGVHVTARDVNGDNLPDVVVSSALDESVVAVLLNQGHGQFSRAEPSYYVVLGKDPDIFLRGCDSSLCDNLTVASARYSFDGERAGGLTQAVAMAGDAVRVGKPAAMIPAAVLGCRGRSPPKDVFQS